MTDLWTTAPGTKGGALLFHRGTASSAGTSVTVQDDATWSQMRSLS